jgi:hypothetical protein
MPLNIKNINDNIKYMSLNHTFELAEVKEATLTLISENAKHLIQYIYNNKDRKPYNLANIRIGLVMKTLLKADSTSYSVSSDTLEPVVEDLLHLIRDCKDSGMAEVYKDELRFLRSCSILDDMITLNTPSRF